MYKYFSKELSLLNKNYKTDEFNCILIYGRVGIGKTALIREYIKDKNSIYLLVKPQTIAVLLNSFKNIVAEMLDDKLLKLTNVRDLKNLFEYIVKKEFNEKLVIIIDEFQSLVKLDSSIIKQLKYIIENILVSTNIELILSGSNLSVIDKQILSPKSILYGNATLVLKLEQMTYNDVCRYLEEKELSKETKNDNKKNIVNSNSIEIYSILGGTQKYIKMYQDMKNDKTIFDFIEDTILDKNSYLYNEIERIMQSEVTELSIYYAILESIADDIHKIGDIAATIGQSVQNITAPIAKLISLGIISKLLPITEENRNKSKMGLYFINDNYFRFWFRYVSPNKNHLELGNIELVMDKIKNDINNFITPIYKNIVIQFINNEFATGLDIQWWDKTSKIDIFYIKEKEILFVGDSFYGNENICIDKFIELEKKTKSIKGYYKHNNFKYFLFSNCGFTDELKTLSSELENIVLVLIKS